MLFSKFDSVSSAKLQFNSFQIYSYATAFISSIVNSYLIFLIIVTEIKHVRSNGFRIQFLSQIGPYRWLLVSFALVDICVTLTHAILFPVRTNNCYDYVIAGHFMLVISHISALSFGVSDLSRIQRPSDYGLVCFYIHYIHSIILYLSIQAFVGCSSSTRRLCCWRSTTSIDSCSFASLIMLSLRMLIINFTLVRHQCRGFNETHGEIGYRSHLWLTSSSLVSAILPFVYDLCVWLCMTLQSHCALTHSHFSLQRNYRETLLLQYSK